MLNKLKKKIIRYSLVETHMKIVKEGKYELARKLLKLLIDKNISLGLSDIDNELEKILEKAGCKLCYGSRYSCRAYI